MKRERTIGMHERRISSLSDNRFVENMRLVAKISCQITIRHIAKYLSIPHLKAAPRLDTQMSSGQKMEFYEKLKKL